MAQVQEVKSDRLNKLKEKANKEIDRRIIVLTHLLELIADAKKLSSEQKATLISQVQAEITALNTLKTKIAADTDLATLRTDVQAIVKSYRIFALFVPKIHILIKADRTLDLADKTSSLAAKLEERISALPEGAPNKVELTTLLTTMKKQIDDARSEARMAINTVTLLTPEGYPGNKTSLMAARVLLRQSHKNLMTAHKISKEIIKGLRKSTVTEAPSISVTVSAVPSPSVSPTVAQ
jgi:hypothetical protein